MSAYRNSYSSTRVLLRFIENWKQYLDDKNFVWTVLVYLSKAYLLIAKFHTNGLSGDAVTLYPLI